MQQHIEMPEGTKAGTGACRYCGQTRLFPDGGAWSPEELNEAATGLCTCTGAQRAKEADRRKATTLKQAEDIFQKDPEILSLVEELIPVILQGIIRKVSLESEDGVKASICLTSSGKITVSRKKMSNRTVTV